MTIDEASTSTGKVDETCNICMAQGYPKANGAPQQTVISLHDEASTDKVAKECSMIKISSCDLIISLFLVYLKKDPV